MNDIEYQIKNRPEYNSKSDFVAQAVEEKLEKLKAEETANAFASIRSNFDHQESYYARQGITSFEDYLNKIGNAKEVGDIRKEVEKSKKDQKRIEKDFNQGLETIQKMQSNLKDMLGKKLRRSKNSS